MSTEQLIHELIMARAKIHHLESYHRMTKWVNLSPELRDSFMSQSRLSVEPEIIEAREQP